jgi:hypothetical protein
VTEKDQLRAAISLACLDEQAAEKRVRSFASDLDGKRWQFVALLSRCARQFMTGELAPGDAPLIVEREPRSSAASIRHRRKFYFVFPLSEVQRVYQAGLPDLQSFAQCSSAGQPAARSYRPVVQVIYTDLHIFGIVRRSASLHPCWMNRVWNGYSLQITTLSSSLGRATELAR